MDNPEVKNKSKQEGEQVQYIAKDKMALRFKITLKYFMVTSLLYFDI